MYTGKQELSLLEAAISEFVAVAILQCVMSYRPIELKVCL